MHSKWITREREHFPETAPSQYLLNMQMAGRANGTVLQPTVAVVQCKQLCKGTNKNK